MTDYLVYNDQTGDFVDIESILAVVHQSGGGSLIILRGSSGSIRSDLGPRELLKRLTIIRYKRENGTSTAARTTANTGAEERNSSAASGQTVAG